MHTGASVAAKAPRATKSLDGFFDDALGELALDQAARCRFLDAAGIAGVAIVALVFILLAGEDDFFGVDDDDVVAAIDVGGIKRAMLALEAQGNEGCETAND